MLDVDTSITADKFAPVEIGGTYTDKQKSTFMRLSPSHPRVNIQISRKKVESDLIDLVKEQYYEDHRSMYEYIQHLKPYIDQPQVL